MMQKTYFLTLFGILLLCCCQPSQQKTVPEQQADTAIAIQSNLDEVTRKEGTSTDTEGDGMTHVPDSFKRFIDSLPEWTADTIGTRDIFYCDADMDPEYAEKFEMRNRLEEEESISVSPQFMYKVTLEGCYVIFVEKQVLGCTTTDGFYAGRWTHSIMTCTKDGQMIEKMDLGNNFTEHRGYCHIKGTRSPLRLEVENVYYVVGNGEKWRAPQPSRICRMEYLVNPKNGLISRDTLAVYDCDRYIGKQGQDVWKNLKERATKNRRKSNTTDYHRPQTVMEWIECFPEWTADSISEHIFDASGLVAEDVAFPKVFRHVAGQDSARQEIIDVRYGHRITTDSLYFLFARKVCTRRNPSDNLAEESFFAQTIMVYSHDGQLKEQYDVTRNLPSKNRTHVSGCRKPFRLHVKEATLLEHDYERTHYIPVLYRETEWSVTQEGTIDTTILLEEKCRWYPYKHPGTCEPWYEQMSPL